MIDDRSAGTWTPPTREAVRHALRYAAMYRDAERAYDALERSIASIRATSGGRPVPAYLEESLRILRHWRM